MYFDFSEISAFYKSPVGQRAFRRISPLIAKTLDLSSRHHMMGFGFTRPYLNMLEANFHPLSLAEFSPARMGIATWMGEQGNRSALVSGKHLPLKDESYDRILLVHALEFSRNARQLLREVGRVLKSDGKLVVVVSSRHGFWARGDHTPFGAGAPLSRNQVRGILEDHGFEILASQGTLYCPPKETGFLRQFEGTLENFGPRLMPLQAGVHIMTVQKKRWSEEGGSKSPVTKPQHKPVPIVGM